MRRFLNCRLLFWWLPLLPLLACAQAPGLTATYSAEVFPLVRSQRPASIYVDARDAAVVRLAAEALARDVATVTGATPALRSATDELADYPVLLGTLGQSALIDQLAAANVLDGAALRGKWETFTIQVVDRPLGRVGKALVVAGSDRRGTAYGVFELARRLGVSPWSWWADVKPHHQDNLYLTAGTYQSAPPTVKYRGIFLNDEDWGLQPWAAQKMDKDIKDIGPNTYARLFELLLRLKANLIWPAMHPSTRAFFHYPGNAQTAERYAIMVGTSHAEPMLRNNVDEWDNKTMGAFDYFHNKPLVLDYWRQRVEQARKQDAIYTMGMRGIHDGAMQGAKTNQEAAQILARIIADQRELLRRYVNPDVTRVPQVFTAYKEVLDVYDEGLKLPDDITLGWPDDNYGYINRLSNTEEQRRAGGSGVYYHASYWGQPHDYLWLSSTHPALIWEEMMKAYGLQARQLWVLNVGDLKPIEYDTQLFLDMAYDARPFAQSSYVPQHLQQWLQEAFGAEHAAELRRILWEYYDLAFERRPEFMGWSQTEPTTPTHRTAYNHFAYGDEAQRRLDRYAALMREVRALRSRLDPTQADAFYELVYYPVVGAAWLNQKFLYQDKSYLYARQNRASAAGYAARARLAYDSIALETTYFNQQLAGGKWQGMMDYHPRNLPVFAAPTAPVFHLDTTQVWGVAPEGWPAPDSANPARLRLPVFEPWGPASQFIDVFLSRRQAVRWRAKTSASWLVLSARQGTLATAPGQQQQRLAVHIDWQQLPTRGAATGYVTFTGAGKTFRVAVRAQPASSPEVQAYTGFIETQGYVSIPADGHTRLTGTPARQWGTIEAPGRPGQALQAQPLQAEPLPTTAPAATAAYDFYTLTEAAPVVTVITLPTHEPTRALRQRYGVAIDDGPVQVLDIMTQGRSKEWKQNVLSNTARRQVKLASLRPGRHTLKLTVIDPGVVLDRFLIDLGGQRPAYSSIPATRKTAGYPPAP